MNLSNTNRQDSQHPSSLETSHDPFESYDIGITTLLQQLGTDHPRYHDALGYESRLRENIAHARRYGNDRASQTQRHEIIESLNALARDTLNTSFNALCPALPDLDHRNRTRMLEHVQDFWIKGVLEQSLYREMLIDLGMEYTPDAVHYPWDMVQHRPDRANTTLPAHTRMIDVFTEACGELLILGAPGSGKTTMLLDLARTLVAQAQHDDTQPIPVVFPLSTWAAFVEEQTEHATLADWLIAELHQRYSVPKKTAQALVEQNQIQPLLDGVDEVPQQHRASCVEAINAYRIEYGKNGIVVCCRVADYEAIPARLEVREAVTLQPLQSQQIDDYLAQAGDEVAVVRTLLRDDADMRELANTPLMLHIMVLAYTGVSVEAVPDTGPLDERRTHLFDRYVQRMLQRQEGPHMQRYPPDKSVRWLSWLAGHVQQHHQTVFQLEQMQPTWLGMWWQRVLYVLLSGVLTGGCGLLMGSIVGLLLGLLFGLGVEGAILLAQGNADTLASLEKYSVPTAPWEGLRVSLGVGLGTGLGIGLTTGLGIGLVVGLGHMVYPHRQVWPAMLGALAGGVWSLVPWMLLWMLLGFPTEDSALFWSIVSAVPTLLVIGLLVYQGQRTMIERVRWSWARLQSHWWIALLVGLLVGLVGSLGNNLGDGLVIGLVVSLVVGLVGSLGIGLGFGLGSREIHPNVRPHERIWHSCRQAFVIYLVVGLGSALVVGLVFGLIFSQSVGVLVGLSSGLGVGLVFGLVFSPAVSLSFGGLAFAQHWAVRAVCSLSGNTPWQYARFLDYAKDHILLRRVGSGYIFIHRTILEYFAANARQ